MDSGGRSRLGTVVERPPARVTAPSRVIIEGVTPEIDAGQFPIKRTVGEEVVVEANIFAEGHDVLKAVVLHRKLGAPDWVEAPMDALVNDSWRGRFTPSEMGRYEYTVLGWVDRFASWHRELTKKSD